MTTAAAPTTAPVPSAPEERLAATVDIGQHTVPIHQLPSGLHASALTGLVSPTGVDGAMLYRNRAAGLYETRLEVMPDGDLLLLFPDALPGAARGHYCQIWPRATKCNVMRGLRSRDRGRTWSPPFIAYDQPFNHHAFVPLRPRGSQRVYAFGTQPNFTESDFLTDGTENAPIGWRHSDDAGRTWSDIHDLRPVNDPGYQGMAVNRMAETPSGTWLIASSHHRRKAQPTTQPARCHLHLLRSADQGRTWQVLPGPRGSGWRDAAENLSEATVVGLADGSLYLQARSTTGVLWEMRSRDDGLTWSDPQPTVLVHAWSPSMLFACEEGRLLASFHHQVGGGSWFDERSMRCRGQLWVSLSRDGARTWEPPRFVCTNALQATTGDAWRDYNCSYADAIVHRDELHLVIPHRWQRVVYLRLRLADVERLPTAAGLRLA